MKIIFVTILFVLINPSKSFQQTAKEYESKLTNNDYQIWVLDSTEERLSTENCINGITYKFFLSEKSGFKKECQNGKWVITNFKWEVVKNSESEYLITIVFIDNSRVKYELDFLLINGETILRLREPLAPDVTTITKDYFFHKN